MSEERRTRCGTVALFGRPNAGKSTLLNRLVGERVSIVTHKPQTTRHRVTGIVNRPGGQLVLVDTPGLYSRMRFGYDLMTREFRNFAAGHIHVGLGTDVEEGILATEATLTGELTGLGGANSATVGIPTRPL